MCIYIVNARELFFRTAVLFGSVIQFASAQEATALWATEQVCSACYIKNKFKKSIKNKTK